MLRYFLVVFTNSQNSEEEVVIQHRQLPPTISNILLTNQVINIVGKYHKNSLINAARTLLTKLFSIFNETKPSFQVKYIWTSGRLCDFKGCDRADLQPLSINGWFWTAVLQKLAPTTQRDQNDWSESGGIGRPQPDNREAQQGGAPENCLAVLNQFYNDGVNWHDVACHHVKPFVCEENEDLLKYVRFTNPNLGI